MSLFDDPGVGAAPEPTFSVGELSDAIGHALRASFRQEVWVRGEIHDLSRPRSGHVYLTLVEQREDGSKASISVMLSAANKVAVNRALTRAGGRVRMVDGTEVRIRGRLDWYGPRGQLQLRMTAIDPAYTLGQLELARAELLARLAEEGLLDRNRSLAMPLVPLRVGLVTSRGSAAEADFLHELTASGLAFHVIAVDVRVQGTTAPLSIARGLASAAARACDVVALVRGGGARTDLAAFDSEVVARAVATCPVPVLTGVGHEVDRSVADDLAHTVAKTPTAGAQVLVARVADHLARVEDTWGVIARLAQRDLDGQAATLHERAGRVQRSARSCLAGAEQRLDERARAVPRASMRALVGAETRLGRDLGRVGGAARVQLGEATSVLAGAERRLAGRGPRAVSDAERGLGDVERRLAARLPRLVAGADKDVAGVAQRFVARLPRLVDEADHRVDGLEHRLVGQAPRPLLDAERRLGALDARRRALDPERALARGWSITTTAGGRLVRSPDDVAAGTHLVTRLAGGEVRSTVDGDA